MLIVLLLALALGIVIGVLAPAAWLVGSLWSAIPRSNADFEWLDV